jgi:hypothetical protein
MTRTLALAGAALLALSAPAGAQQDFHWSQRLARGEEIKIKNVIGDVRAEPTTAGEVTVTAVRRGPGAERVRIEVVHRDEGWVVCALYPSDGGDDDDGWVMRNDGDNDGEPRDACNPRRMSVRRGSPAVDFTVHVPAGVPLAASTVSGDVHATDLRGAVRASSVSGDVDVSADGPVKATSVSGDVAATVRRLGGEGGVKLSTVSGDVTLRLPAGADADLSARTLSGRIESDFPVRLGSMDEGRNDDRDGGFVRVNVRIGHEARARLGRGGPEIKINTVSGDITLRQF